MLAGTGRASTTSVYLNIDQIAIHANNPHILASPANICSAVPIECNIIDNNNKRQDEHRYKHQQLAYREVVLIICKYHVVKALFS
eukprot:12648-Heterococcus_DN1.PRE.5